MGKYFTINELTKSSTASRLHINNTPSQEVKDNLNKLIDNVLDPLRELYGKPIIVNSGYRCPKLNKAIGGARNSQHLIGQASDIRTVTNTKESNKQLFDIIRNSKLPFDQLINEYDFNWVHVSYGPRNRRQVLTIK